MKMELMRFGLASVRLHMKESVSEVPLTAIKIKDHDVSIYMFSEDMLS